MKKVMLILLVIVMVSLIGCTVVEEPRKKPGQKPILEIFADEEAADKKIAVIIITDTNLELQVIEEVSPEIQELKTALGEISSKETLPLEVEDYVDGNYVLGEIQVSKNAEEYPYAVQHALLKYGYRSEVRVE